MLAGRVREPAPGETDLLEHPVDDARTHLPSPRPSSDGAGGGGRWTTDHALVQLLHEERQAADRDRLAALLATAPTPA